MNTPTNSRFLLWWGLLFPVISAALLIVSGSQHWSPEQTVVVTGFANSVSGVVLAGFAYLWAKTVEEPATFFGAVSSTLLTLFALGNVFSWWSLTQAQEQAWLTLIGALVVVLAFVVRGVVYAPKTIDKVKADAATPDAVRAAMNPKLLPPDVAHDPSVVPPEVAAIAEERLASGQG